MKNFKGILAIIVAVLGLGISFIFIFKPIKKENLSAKTIEKCHIDSLNISLAEVKTSAFKTILFNKLFTCEVKSKWLNTSYMDYDYLQFLFVCENKSENHLVSVSLELYILTKKGDTLLFINNFAFDNLPYQKPKNKTMIVIYENRMSEVLYTDISNLIFVSKIVKLIYKNKVLK